MISGQIAAWLIAREGEGISVAGSTRSPQAPRTTTKASATIRLTLVPIQVIERRKQWARDAIWMGFLTEPHVRASELEHTNH